jgi:hypothetical protein
VVVSCPVVRPMVRNSGLLGIGDDSAAVEIGLQRSDFNQPLVVGPRARSVSPSHNAEYGTSRALGVSEGLGATASALSRQASVKHFTHAMRSLVIASPDRCSAGWVR